MPQLLLTMVSRVLTLSLSLCILARSIQLTPPLAPASDAELRTVHSHVRAYFDLVESELPSVDYSRVPECGPDWLSYINLVVHVQKQRWTVVCGDPKGKNSRGKHLIDILDRVVPSLDAEIDVYLPFGLHDGVANLHGLNPDHPPNQNVPVLGSVFTQAPPGTSACLPFAMGCERNTHVPYMNTPVVGWDALVKEQFSCASDRPVINKAVFRGKASDRRSKFGTCTNACSWKDNGRLLLHGLGQRKPDQFDSGVSNSGSYGMAGAVESIPLPAQLCNYTAVLNIGNNMDWAERLRQSFFGNAVVMIPGPENMPHEYFTSFLEPYVNYWPIKPDLSDVEEQVAVVLEAARSGDEKISRVLVGQRSFRERFLTEAFMLMYDKVVIEEYYRRTLAFKQQSLRRSEQSVAKARALLNAEKCVQYKTDCGDLPGPAFATH